MKKHLDNANKSAIMSLKHTQRRKYMDRSSIKAMAKQQIKGNVAMLFVISLIIFLVSLVVNLVPLIGAIASIFVIMPAFSLGLIMIYLNITKGQKAAVSDLFSEFNNFGGAIAFAATLFSSTLLFRFDFPQFL